MRAELAKGRKTKDKKRRKRGPEARPERPPIEEYVSGRLPPDENVTRPSGEVAVPIVCDIELDRGRRREAVNVMNSEGYIESLPRNAVVEVPATVDAEGVHAERVGPLPEPFAALIRPHLAITELVTEAWRTREKKLLVQALLLDPNVDSLERARKLVEEMLALQKDYLREFS